MKKFIAIVALLCAVLVSSTASAAAPMPEWEFVKNDLIHISPNPKYSKSSNEVYEDAYQAHLLSGRSSPTAHRLAQRQAREYQAKKEADLWRVQYLQNKPKGSLYIATNYIYADQTTEGGVAFRVLVRYDYTPSGAEVYVSELKKAGKNISPDMENLSFVICVIHFKSTNGITKYCALTDRVAFTTDGKTIEALDISNAPFKWEFINPGSNMDAVFNAAYKRL